MKLLPEAAAEFASRVDFSFWLVSIISLVFFVLILFLIIYFPIRYKRREGDADDAPDYRSSHVLEAIWTIIPTILCLIIFAYGLSVYNEIRAVPEGGDAIEVRVEGRMWDWVFTYPDGRKTINDLYVPLDQPVRLMMRSADVLHSFFIPAFRTKQDLMPNQYTKLWFKPTKVGTFDVFCTEYCGTGHSDMIGKVHVLSADDYAAWQSESEAEEQRAPVELGEALYAERGCNACHSIDGTRGVGPTLAGLWGKTEELQNGETVQVDEDYLRESILEPGVKIVATYPPSMPSFQGLLNEDEIAALIAYIKSLSDEGGAQ